MAHAIINETEATLVQEVLQNNFETLTPEHGVGSELDKETFEFLRDDRVIQANQAKFIEEQAQTFSYPLFEMPGGVPGMLV